MQKLLTILFMSCFLLQVHADALDSLKAHLENNVQVQEKIYIHMDNNCYFIGDTLWYKAYVLRADELTITDMSKMVYVELLSPDGLVVQRQRLIVSNRGFACGQFVLTDSLYSGYYELRAYTKWMLNFHVFEREYTKDASHMFYSGQMAKDFFRDWDGLYSRVFPVYAKPETEGDYEGKYMYQRPKQRVVKAPADRLQASFYPEGGSLVKGVKSRVAFELNDQFCMALDIPGELSDGTPLKPVHMGRGTFEFTPTGGTPKARFTWKGKNYSFSLPKVQDEGVVLGYSEGEVRLSASPRYSNGTFALAALCRGRLARFEKLTMSGGQATVRLPLAELPTGVNELMLFDEAGKILASRLIFVNNHDLTVPMEVSTGGKTDYQPFEPITVEAQSGVPTLFSISVRDGSTDDASFNDGNIMTDMLLSSELKGFIAHPAYYFESDDETHRLDLDLLMMVQGWRRYRPFPIRYQPETSLVIEGQVNKMLGIDMLELDEVAALDHNNSISSVMMSESGGVGLETGGTFTETEPSAEQNDAAYKAESESSGEEDFSYAGSFMGVNHGNLKHEVIVEAELTDGHKTVGAATRTTHGGVFKFQLPPYYGDAVLLMKAYEPKDSLKKCMTSHSDKGMLDEEKYPDFYVKQDLFYPVFSHPYTYYQNHLPDIEIPMLDDGFYEDEEADEDIHSSRKLQTVNVKGKRRGRRGIDYTKPAQVMDAYDLYNLATDRGLSWGAVNMGTFPYKACYVLYGNMERYNTLHVRAKLDNYTFYKNYQAVGDELKNRADARLYKDLHLRRIQNIRFFTDYELRNPGDSLPESLNQDDITIVYEPVPDDGKRLTYRDRRYILPGIAYPEDFYHPDYSTRPAEDAKDYRRTLYWNPNACTDKNGTFTTTFYNNARATRIRVSAAGVTPDGRFVYSE